MKKSDLFFNVARLPIDFVMLLIAGIVSYVLRTQILDAFRPVLFQFNLPFFKYFYLVLLVSVIFIGAYASAGLYSMRVRIGKTEELLKIIVGSSAGVLTIVMYIFLRQELFNSRYLVLGGWFFSIIFVFIGRLLARYVQNFLVSKYDFGIHKVMIVGNDDITRGIVDDIKINRSSGYRIAGHLINPELEEVKKAVSGSGVDEVILADPNYSTSKIVGLVDFCHENHIIFKFVPNMYQTLTTNFEVDVINGLPLIGLKRTRLDGWGRVIKRVADIFGSLIGLIILSPVFGLLAVVIRSGSEGPVFARLKRVSRNKEFFLLKFRSMVKNAEDLKPGLAAYNERKDGPLFKMKDDPRVTRIGRAIRRYRIDELAQLVNVLKGDMSLVGPRPHQPDEIALYQRHHKKLLAIKAGATGMAQVSGSSDLPFEEEVKLDSFYIENWSLLLDLRIIFKTIWKIFSDKSAV